MDTQLAGKIGGKKRWEGISKEERSKKMSEIRSKGKKKSGDPAKKKNYEGNN